MLWSAALTLWDVICHGLFNSVLKLPWCPVNVKSFYFAASKSNFDEWIIKKEDLHIRMTEKYKLCVLWFLPSWSVPCDPYIHEPTMRHFDLHFPCPPNELSAGTFYHCDILNKSGLIVRPPKRNGYSDLKSLDDASQCDTSTHCNNLSQRELWHIASWFLENVLQRSIRPWKKRIYLPPDPQSPIPDACDVSVCILQWDLFLQRHVCAYGKSLGSEGNIWWKVDLV